MEARELWKSPNGKWSLTEYIDARDTYGHNAGLALRRRKRLAAAYSFRIAMGRFIWDSMYINANGTRAKIPGYVMEQVKKNHISFLTKCKMFGVDIGHTKDELEFYDTYGS